MAYLNYKIEDFVADEYFIKWVKSPDEETNAFWNSWLTQHPQKRPEAIKAREIVLLLDIKVNPAGEGKFLETWEKILERTDERLDPSVLILQASPGHAAVGGRNISWYYKVAATLTLIALAFGGYKFYQSGKHQTETNVAQIDFRPGRDKAILQLADGKKLELEASDDNEIPRQGVAQVNRGNGRLAYQATGDVTEVLYNTILVPRGGQYHVTLSDGSNVWLNSASSLRFPVAFTGNDRVVELTGEAYFEIAAMRQSSGNKMPFKVRVASGTEVEVLGTHFNIMAYDEEDAIKTTLLEGAVKINQSTVEHGSVLLKPSQQARISKNGDISVIENFDVNEAVAWKNGAFIFNDTELDVIMRQMSRWYDVEVVLEDDVRSLEFGGVVSRKENASAVLNLLALTGAVDFQIEGRKITAKSIKK